MSDIRNMNDIAIRVTNLTKLYRIGVAERQPQSLGGLTRGLLSSPFAYLQRMLRPPHRAGDVVGPARRLLRGAARGGSGHHRPQRRGEEHVAEDPLPHHRAVGRPG